MNSNNFGADNIVVSIIDPITEERTVIGTMKSVSVDKNKMYSIGVPRESVDMTKVNKGHNKRYDHSSNNPYKKRK